MRRARVFVNGNLAGILEEKHMYFETKGSSPTVVFSFVYSPEYFGPPVSLTMPVNQRHYSFSEFPAFFEGVLPEGAQLEGLLRREKIDRSDFFGQLMAVGSDLVGAVTVEEYP